MSIEVKRLGPPIPVTEQFITEAYEDGLPEAEAILRMARKKGGNDLFISFMQNTVDNMKKWIKEHPE